MSSATAMAELPNGIYSVAEETADTGTLVTRADDHGRVKLQKLLSSGFGTASLVSAANDNEQFRLKLDKAGPFRDGFLSVHQALYIDGVCVLFGSREELDGQRRSTLIGDFASLKNAQTIAKALSINPKLRQHPGHKLLVKWTPKQRSFKPNEPIEVTLTAENVGDVEIHFLAGGRQRGPRDNQFAFIAHSGSGHGKAIPDTGDPTNFGGLGSFITLKPGESFTKSVDISKWFKLDAGDSCRLTCLYQIELSVLEANSDSLAWDEFLTGQCSVRISE
ncbi:MAG: hypothetical protein IAG10_33250 [Planctomycetaceae bacterium]|nr:hypothetical protein [Planctomycetaceae bacterium]